MSVTVVMFLTGDPDEHTRKVGRRAAKLCASTWYIAHSIHLVYSAPVFRPTTTLTAFSKSDTAHLRMKDVQSEASIGGYEFWLEGLGSGSDLVRIVAVTGSR